MYISTVLTNDTSILKLYLKGDQNRQQDLHVLRRSSYPGELLNVWRLGGKLLNSRTNIKTRWLTIIYMSFWYKTWSLASRAGKWRGSCQLMWALGVVQRHSFGRGLGVYWVDEATADQEDDANSLQPEFKPGHCWKGHITIRHWRISLLWVNKYVESRRDE